MFKNYYLKAITLLICVMFISSFVPTLNSAEKNVGIKINIASVKHSFRILIFIFPMLTAFINTHKNDLQNKEFVDENNNQNLIVMPAVEASSNTPKTKD